MTGDLLHSIISDNGTVDAIIDGRIHPSADPQKLPLPKVTYEHVTSDFGRDNDGVHISRYPFQVDCWAATYKGANDLATAVVAALNLYDDDEVMKIVVEDCFDNSPVLEPGKEKRSIHRKTIRATISV